MGKIWRENKVLASAFILAVLVACFFAIRFTIFTIYWSDPAHRQQLIESWMTIGYISHSWHVPRQAFIDQLKLEPRANGKPLSLAEIAKSKGISEEELKAQIQSVIRQAQTEQKQP